MKSVNDELITYDKVANYIIIHDKNKMGHAIMKFEAGDVRLGPTFGLCCHYAKENIEVVRIGGFVGAQHYFSNFGGVYKEVTDPQELIDICQTGEVPGEYIDDWNNKLAKAQEEIEAEENAKLTN